MRTKFILATFFIPISVPCFKSRGATFFNASHINKSGYTLDNTATAWEATWSVFSRFYSLSVRKSTSARRLEIMTLSPETYFWCTTTFVGHYWLTSMRSHPHIGLEPNTNWTQALFNHSRSINNKWKCRHNCLGNRKRVPLSAPLYSLIESIGLTAERLRLAEHPSIISRAQVVLETPFWRPFSEFPRISGSQ